MTSRATIGSFGKGSGGSRFAFSWITKPKLNFFLVIATLSFAYDNIRLETTWES